MILCKHSLTTRQKEKVSLHAISLTLNLCNSEWKSEKQAFSGIPQSNFFKLTDNYQNKTSFLQNSASTSKLHAPGGMLIHTQNPLLFLNKNNIPPGKWKKKTTKEMRRKKKNEDQTLRNLQYSTQNKDFFFLWVANF